MLYLQSKKEKKMQKKLNWKNISILKARGLVELYMKEATVLNWDLKELSGGRANLFILVEIPDKPPKK